MNGNFQSGKSCTFLIPDLNFDELLCVYNLLESTIESALKDRIASILENDHQTVETWQEETSENQVDALLILFLELRHKDTARIRFQNYFSKDLSPYMSCCQIIAVQPINSLVQIINPDEDRDTIYMHGEYHKVSNYALYEALIARKPVCLHRRGRLK